MKKLKLIVLFLSTCFFTSLTFAANSTLHYETELVTLTGIIKVEKFPAPPKNEYIGDKEEIYRYLVLDRPIDFIPKKNHHNEKIEPLKKVNDVQIVKLEDDTNFDTWICESCYKKKQFSTNKECNKCPHSNWSDKFVGKHIRVTGTLYSRIVRVVMIANHFEEVK